MGFEKALEAIKNGRKARREGWNGKEQYIALGENLTFETANGTYKPYHCHVGSKAIVFFGTHGIQVGWCASQTDMLAEDWQIVE